LSARARRPQASPLRVDPDGADGLDTDCARAFSAITTAASENESRVRYTLPPRAGQPRVGLRRAPRRTTFYPCGTNASTFSCIRHATWVTARARRSRCGARLEPERRRVSSDAHQLWPGLTQLSCPCRACIMCNYEQPADYKRDIVAGIGRHQPPVPVRRHEAMRAISRWRNGGEGEHCAHNGSDSCRTARRQGWIFGQLAVQFAGFEVWHLSNEARGMTIETPKTVPLRDGSCCTT
jgi:hypothetical protein